MKKIDLLVVFCIYKSVLDICAKHLVRSLDDYAIYIFEFSISKYFFSWIGFLVICGLYILFVFGRDRLHESISQQILLLLMILSIVPVTSLFGAGGLTDSFFGYYLLFFFWLLILYVCMTYLLGGEICRNDLLINWYKQRVRIFWAVGLVSLTTIVAVFYYSGGHFFVDGLNVYKQRAAFEIIQKEIPNVLVYIISIANVVEIYLMLLCLDTKKYKMIPVLLLVWYMHFSLGGQKTILFSELVVMLLYFFQKYISILRVVSLNCVFIMYDNIMRAFGTFNNEAIESTLQLTKRVFFIPARLQEHWVDYFSIHEPNYWGINTQYNIGNGLENIIADIYYQDPFGYANNGLLGDCFANMGVYGIIVYPIVIVLILVAFDFAVAGKDARIFFGLTLLFVTYMINGMFTTVMVSHGGFVMLLMLWLFPPRECVLSNEKKQL